MLGYFFNPNAGFSMLGHFIGLFLIFYPGDGLFLFNPNAGFSLLGHFIGLFLIFFFTQVLGHF